MGPTRYDDSGEARKDHCTDCAATAIVWKRGSTATRKKVGQQFREHLGGVHKFLHLWLKRKDARPGWQRLRQCKEPAATF